MNKNKRNLLPFDMESEEMRARIGERFLLIRRNILKKNQTRMGQILGVSLDRICDFESGKRVTDPVIIYRLMLYLMSKKIDIRLLFIDDFSLDYIQSQREKHHKYKFNNEII
ncbi:MAG: hypothetical protein MJZ11_10765 [Lachnospiraceae bacterium]|nr:hypothetical protein [Lachnospiraceae bacterium]